MTAPVWPSTTGFALADGFNEQFPALALRTETDAGPVKQRFLGEGAPVRVRIAYLMTTAEREWLRWFHGSADAGATGAGAAWFDYTYPLLAAETIARFVADEPPAVQPYKPDWLVTVTLEVVVPLTPPAPPEEP